MCGKGVDFRPYRPLWKTLGSGKLAPRDHGRIFLVDQIAVTGGAAWAKPWAPKDRGGEGWQDINIRIEGPVVADFAELFEQRWREAEGKGAQPKDFDTGKKYDELAWSATRRARTPAWSTRSTSSASRARRSASGWPTPISCRRRR
jgi:phosphatidylserine/phosphatidylglycerophosphate/cardiolipin synthase-like enzyme